VVVHEGALSVAGSDGALSCGAGYQPWLFTWGLLSVSIGGRSDLRRDPPHLFGLGTYFSSLRRLYQPWLYILDLLAIVMPIIKSV